MPLDPGQPVVRLIQALRSPLREQFAWDFRYADTCAIQIAVDSGLLTDADGYCPDGALENLGVTSSSDNPFDAEEIDGVVPLYRVPARDVTPAMVADALERLVAQQAEG